MDLGLLDRVCLVTGSTSGIGLETARLLVAEGARVVYLTVTERDTQHADDTVTAVCDPGEYTPEAPIYDAHVGDLVDANNRLWKHNGAQLITWTCDYSESLAPASASAHIRSSSVSGPPV